MTEPLRGIGYDAGVIYEKDFDSNPYFSADTARRDFQVIRDDLGCDAVMILATKPDRLAEAAEIAVDEGLEVWLQPRPFDEPVETLRETVRATADTAERLRAAGAQVALIVGCELTLSIPGMLPGPTFLTRGMLLSVTFPLLPFANRRLRRPLRDLVADARERFGGRISYGAGSWEQPDWAIFDVVGVDRYRDAQNARSFEDVLRDLVSGAGAHGKSVYVLEFGTCTYEGAADMSPTAAGVLRERKKEMAVPRRLRRDEQEQADYIAELLDVFDRAGVAGSFVYGFSEPALTTSDEPGRDLDLASYGIVAAHSDGSWTPKLAYHALAERYRGRR